MTATLQQQARALGDPTRNAVFRYIVAADRDVDVAELTAHFEVNHNAIRQHLAKLVDAQLVVEAQATPQGRGRPKLLYRVAPSAESRWGATGPYERLSWLLAEVIGSGDSPVEVGRRSVASRMLDRDEGADPVDALVAEMARSGFEPTVRRRGGRVEIVLQSCPYASAVHVDADTVCDLHLGMARGVADHVDGLVVDELVRVDPRRAGCRLRCHLVRPGGSEPSKHE